MGRKDYKNHFIFFNLYFSITINRSITLFIFLNKKSWKRNYRQKFFFLNSLTVYQFIAFNRLRKLVEFHYITILTDLLI